MRPTDTPRWIAAILSLPGLLPISRAALVSAFLIGGIQKLIDFPAAIAEQAHFGLQPAWLWAAAAIVVELGGALWLGNDDPLGHTFWHAIDSSTIAGISSTALKYAFSRARPYQGDNPNLWFQGSGHQSFPSGEVTLQASFVTPFIVDYAKEHPWVWSLEFLPVWDAYARLKSQAHWQTDVIAGWALGTGVGYWSTTRATPLSVQILPHGISVGFSKRF